MSKSATAPADTGDKPKRSPGLLPRLSVPLTADKSRFAVENMTDPVKERLRVVLLDPELRARLDLPAAAAGGAPAAPELGTTWDGELTGILYDVIGRVLVTIAMRQGFTAGEAALLEFSVQEKALLAAPTGAVLDKYFPGGLARYGPEFVLAGALLTVLQGKLFALRRVAAERAASSAPAAASPGGGTLHPFPPPIAAS